MLDAFHSRRNFKTSLCELVTHLASANKKKGKNRCRSLPCSRAQNSSDIAPWMVCTTRAAKCAGSAL